MHGIFVMFVCMGRTDLPCFTVLKEHNILSLLVHVRTLVLHGDGKQLCQSMTMNR